MVYVAKREPLYRRTGQLFNNYMFTVYSSIAGFFKEHCSVNHYYIYTLQTHYNSSKNFTDIIITLQMILANKEREIRQGLRVEFV